MNIRHLLSTIALIVPASLSAAAPAKAARAPSRGGVAEQRVTFPVRLSDGSTYTLVGHYYARGGSHARPLQVLVHGATYDHGYWDAGVINGDDYSYARYMAARGYEVLAVDQLGAGESDKPAGYALDLHEAAGALHQVIASLRTRGNPTGRPFPTIALVGHSNGSLTSIVEESVYHAADALVVTGWGHTYSPLLVDPAYVQSLLGAPYLQPWSIPEPLRAALFYYLPAADPAVVSFDALSLSSTMATGTFIDLLVHLSAPTQDGVGGVTGPVLVQLGDHDAIAPAAYAPLEPGYWQSARVTVQPLADMGHDVNLHRNHAASWTAIDGWLAATLGDDCD